MPTDRPNLLVIITDQQHANALGCEGDVYVHTPNLDRLAASGMRFRRAYATNPVCVPSRYSLLSGYMPTRFDGLEINIQHKSRPQPRVTDWIEAAPAGYALREAGYTTSYGGKLHVQDFNRFTPEAGEVFGFDSLHPGVRDDLAQAAAAFLRAGPTEPFCLWVSLINPHDICWFLQKSLEQWLEVLGGDDELPPLPANFAPTEAEPDWIARFRCGTLGEEETVELSVNRDMGQAAAEWDERTWRIYRAVYRHFMADVDRQIGIVLDALDAGGARDSTLVLFTSDHGDHDAAHGLTMKRSFFDESARVPLIASWPGRVPAGTVDDAHLVSNGLDLLPTLLDFAGCEIPVALPGRSLKQILLGQTPDDWRDYLVGETIHGRMVRTDRWKYELLYVADANVSREMLIDMERDPGESVNLAPDPAHRETLARHRVILCDHVKREGDAAGQRYLAALPLALPDTVPYYLS